MDCLFCKIARREIGAEVVYEDGHAAAFLDIHPKAPGHTMVVPKIHAANILDLPEDEIKPLFSTVKRVVGLLDDAIRSGNLGFTPTPERGSSVNGAEGAYPRSVWGFTIGINHGSVSGQVVEHLHIHIIPRFEGDGGGSIHGVVTNPVNEDIAVTAERIRKGRLVKPLATSD